MPYVRPKPGTVAKDGRVYRSEAERKALLEQYNAAVEADPKFQATKWQEEHGVHAGSLSAWARELGVRMISRYQPSGMLRVVVPGPGETPPAPPVKRGTRKAPRTSARGLSPEEQRAHVEAAYASGNLLAYAKEHRINEATLHAWRNKFVGSPAGRRGRPPREASAAAAAMVVGGVGVAPRRTGASPGRGRQSDADRLADLELEVTILRAALRLAHRRGFVLFPMEEET